MLVSKGGGCGRRLRVLNNLALMASLSVVVGCVYEGPSARHGGYAFRPRTH